MSPKTPLKKTHFKLIVKTLRDELALQTRHVKLLESQQLALLACDRARFTALQDEYALVLVQLEAQEARRNAALTDDAGEPVLLSVLKMESEANHHALQAVEDALRETLETVQGLTRRNQTLIQNELDYLAFSLDLFVEAGTHGGQRLRNPSGRRRAACQPAA